MALKLKENQTETQNNQSTYHYNVVNSFIPGMAPGVPAFPNLYQVGMTRVNTPPPPPIEMPETKIPRAINYYADHGGCGYWRMGWSEYLINLKQKADICGLTAMVLSENFYQNIKAIRLQRQATPHQKEFVKALKDLSNKFKFKLIYEVDDIVFKDDIPDYNRCKEAFDNPEIAKTILEIMQMTDEFTVTCQFMKDYYKSKSNHQKINVLPNYAPKFWLDGFYNEEKLLKRLEKYKKKPRVLYAGSGVHADIVNKTNQKDDFEHVVQAIIKARKDFTFVWKGCFPLSCKPFIDNGEMEFIQWDDLHMFPAGLDAANCNVTFASLQDNIFNKSKSNIKMIEAGALGMPGAFQDMCTYDGAELKFKTGDELIDLFKLMTKDFDTYNNFSKNGRKFASGLWLEDHLDEVMALYFTDWASKERNIMAPTLIKNNPEQKC
jgi:hypothetical protein